MVDIYNNITREVQNRKKNTSSVFYLFKGHYIVVVFIFQKYLNSHYNKNNGTPKVKIK